MLDQDHPAGPGPERASPERHLLPAAHPHLSLAIAVEPVLEAHPQRPFPWDITLGLASDTPRRRPLKYRAQCAENAGCRVYSKAVCVLRYYL